jgi:RES domain-containing protein
MLHDSQQGGYSGQAFRHCSPEYAEVSTKTLDGSKRDGGRFNPKGEFGAVYVALNRRTAERELSRLAERLGFTVDMLLPRAMLTLDINLGAVLDLTLRGTQKEWGLTPDALRASDFAICQEVARAARRDGYEAILFPSATGEGLNLAIFFDQLRPGSRVNIVKTEEFVPSLVPDKSFLHFEGLHIVGEVEN